VQEMVLVLWVGYVVSLVGVGALSEGQQAGRDIFTGVVVNCCGANALVLLAEISSLPRGRYVENGDYLPTALQRATSPLLSRASPASIQC
jgi:hypothetical protein